MKKRFLVLLLALMISSLFLTGCNAENKALTLLNEANSNFSELNSYVRAEYQVNKVGGEFIETHVKFSQFLIEEEMILTSNNRNFTLAYPRVILNSEELREHKPTLVIEMYPTEEGVRKKIEYISPEEEDYFLFKSNETLLQQIKINKEDMFNLLETVSTGSEEEVLIEAYTMGLFNVNVFPDKIKELQIQEETEEFFILKGYISGNPDEMFLLYEEASVEIWIDKENMLVTREVYKMVEGQEEDIIIYEYFYFNEDEIPNSIYKDKDIEDKIEFFKDLTLR